MRIALIGFGGVGKAFIELLHDKHEILKSMGLTLILKSVMNSKGGIYNPMGIDPLRLIEHVHQGGELCEFPDEGIRKETFQNLIMRRDVDLLIETTPTNNKTGEPGLTHISKALERGFHVVTANKGPVLLAYKQLCTLAAKSHVQLGIGCTTGGALPTINAGRFDLAGAQILSIEGILNGTSNYILSEMEERDCSYEEALKQAQQMGIAETDPSLDVEGWDTATKLLILTNILMEEEHKLREICVEGITRLSPQHIQEAKKEGKRLKLIGKAERKNNGTALTVGIEALSQDHPLFNVNSTNKAVRYITDTLGDLTVIGGASGTKPAAASILRDIINIYKGYPFV